MLKNLKFTSKTPRVMLLRLTLVTKMKIKKSNPKVESLFELDTTAKILDLSGRLATGLVRPGNY